MLDSILYLVFSFLYPNRKDFIRMGLGIKQRRKEFCKDWDYHLKKSKEFINKVFNQYGSEINRLSVLVLGAGRLYDFPLDQLGKFKHITLVDADPLALMETRLKVFLKFGLKPKVKYKILDVTSCYDQFGLDKIKCAKEPDFNWGKYDIVVSLNLLGQIPLYFLDKLEDQELTKKSNQLEVFCQNLQRNHVKACVKSAQASVVFIFDKEFYFYEEKDKSFKLSYKLTAVSQEIFDQQNIQVKLSDSWEWKVSLESTHLISAWQIVVS